MNFVKQKVWTNQKRNVYWKFEYSSFHNNLSDPYKTNLPVRCKLKCFSLKAKSWLFVDYILAYFVALGFFLWRNSCGLYRQKIRKNLADVDCLITDSKLSVLDKEMQGIRSIRGSITHNPESTLYFRKLDHKYKNKLDGVFFENNNLQSKEGAFMLFPECVWFPSLQKHSPCSLAGSHHPQEGVYYCAYNATLNQYKLVT